MSVNVALESSAMVIADEKVSSMRNELYVHGGNQRHLVFLQDLSRRVSMSVIINHVEGLKAQLEEWLNIMSEDPHFAPPAWVMESMWTRCNVILSLIPSDED